jgi:hypothetical protein
MSPNPRLSAQDAWSHAAPSGTVSLRFIRRFAASPSHVARPPLRAFSDIARRGPAPLADRPPLAVLATIALPCEVVRRIRRDIGSRQKSHPPAAPYQSVHSICAFTLPFGPCMISSKGMARITTIIKT